MADANETPGMKYLQENFKPLPPDTALKTYVPTPGDKPQIDPMQPPPFTIGGPIGTKPEGGSSGNQNDPGGGGNPAATDPNSGTKP